MATTSPITCSSGRCRRNTSRRSARRNSPRKPVGTGPWKFVSRTIKEEIKFEAFDDYWNKEHRPTVKNLTIKMIPEDLTRVAAFKTGAVDWIDAVPLAMVEEFKKMPGVKTQSFVTPNNLYLSMDATSPNSPFKDVRVRQAVAHAIDVDAIIKSVLFGQGERYVQVGKGSLGYDPDLKPYPFDPKKARELLKRGRLSERLRDALLQPDHAARAERQGNGRGDVRLSQRRRHPLQGAGHGIRVPGSTSPAATGRAAARWTGSTAACGARPSRRSRHALGRSCAHLRARQGLGQRTPSTPIRKLDSMLEELKRTMDTGEARGADQEDRARRSTNACSAACRPIARSSPSPGATRWSSGAGRSRASGGRCRKSA